MNSCSICIEPSCQEIRVVDFLLDNERSNHHNHRLIHIKDLSKKIQEDNQLTQILQNQQSDIIDDIKLIAERFKKFIETSLFKILPEGNKDLEILFQNIQTQSNNELSKDENKDKLTQLIKLIESQELREEQNNKIKLVSQTIDELKIILENLNSCGLDSFIKIVKNGLTFKRNYTYITIQQQSSFYIFRSYYDLGIIKKQLREKPYVSFVELSLKYPKKQLFIISYANLNLDINNKKPYKLDDLGQLLEQCNKIVDFQFSAIDPNFEKFDPISKALEQMVNLKILRLNLEQQRDINKEIQIRNSKNTPSPIKDVTKLGQSMRQLKLVQDLSLNLQQYFQLIFQAGIYYLFFYSVQIIYVTNLSLQSKYYILNIFSFFVTISIDLQLLIVLGKPILNNIFTRKSDLANIGEVLRGIKEMNQLKSIYLNLRNTKFNDYQNLYETLKQIQTLTKVTINLVGTHNQKFSKVCTTLADFKKELDRN